MTSIYFKIVFFTSIAVFLSSLAPMLVGTNAYVTIKRIENYNLTSCQVQGYNTFQKEGYHDMDGNYVQPRCYVTASFNCSNNFTFNEDLNCYINFCTESIDVCKNERPVTEKITFFVSPNFEQQGTSERGTSEQIDTDKYYKLINRTWGFPLMIAFASLGFLALVSMVVSGIFMCKS